MHIRVAHRGSSAALTSSNRACLEPRCSLARSRSLLNIQTRTLWWWGRRRNHWSTLIDEEVEERIQRQHKILAQRYHRALRRRAMWESDTSPSTPWTWRLSKRWIGCKNLSSGKSSSARVGDREDDFLKAPNLKAPREWETLHQEFESFKREVDKAIERDPAGTLFGRRLQSPPSANPWTSFSWFWDPKEIKDPNTPAGEATQSKPNPPAKVKAAEVISQKPIAPVMKAEAHEAEPEYVYDPVSGRKVPKADSARNERVPKVPILRSLFAEHGVEVPVKPYKPHKVYGYSDKVSSLEHSVGFEDASTVKRRNDSSRIREFQALKAATLGNSIDTAAEFGGKYQPATDSVEPPPPGNKHRGSGEPNEDAPLFSEGFANTPVENVSVKATRAGDHFDEKPAAHTSAIDIPVKTYKGRLQTSLDRMSSTSQPSEPAKSMPIPQPAGKDKDIDKLTPSDVRAATKAKTTGKVENSGEISRSRSESGTGIASSKASNDRSAAVAESFASRTTNFTKSLANVWEHVKKYPQGVVARTVDKMSFSRENWKNYTSSDKSDLLGKIVFKDESLSKTPSIFKNVGHEKRKAVEPSRKIINVEHENAAKQSAQKAQAIMRENAARLSALKQANEASAKTREEQKLQALSLAKQIREVYETEYGKIDENHRQPVAPSAPQTPSSLSRELNKPSSPAAAPLKSASVKPGCEPNPVVVRHIEYFEPKFARIVDRLRMMEHGIRASEERYRISQMLLVESQRTRAEEAFLTQKAAFTSQASGESSLKPEPSATQPSEADAIPSETQNTATPKASHMILTFNPESQTVRKTPLTPGSGFEEGTRKKTLPDILANLNRSDEYLRHFRQLENDGYELVNGGLDVLIFKLRPTTTSTTTPDAEPVDDHLAESRIAAEEIAAQPTSSPSTPTKQAASVLDEIPPEAGPAPGPAAPTAPGPTTTTQGPKVKRQENVFSGTMKTIPTPPPTLADPQTSSSSSSQEQPTPEAGFFARAVRTVRRAVLTVVGLGVGAYIVGVIAEGLGAQAQQRNGLEDSQAMGPRKRVVVMGQRPGIYSTESSR